jgi:hypothetical protein
MGEIMFLINVVISCIPPICSAISNKSLQDIFNGMEGTRFWGSLTVLRRKLYVIIHLLAVTRLLQTMVVLAKVVDRSRKSHGACHG